MAMINDAHLFDPLDILSKIKNVVTIFHGDADSVVPIYKSEAIAKSLEEQIELVKIPFADHGFAVAGDDDLTSEGTKNNHFYVYSEMIKRIANDY